MSNPSLFVAAGNAGKLATSPDGTTWTLRTSSFGAEYIKGAAWSPALSLFVAVGNSGKLATSPDGVNWTQRTSGFGINYIDNVAWSPSLALFVAVGNSGKLATSPDGITWTLRTYPHTGYINDVAWSPALSLFVAGGFDGLLATSPDGITWTARTSTFVATETVAGVVWAPLLGLFVIVGFSGKIATSPDGIAWTARTSGTAADLQAVAWSPSLALFVIGGQSGVLRTSPDGITWTGRTSSIVTDTILTAAWSSSLSLFAVGAGAAKLSTSPDGINWTVRTSNFGADPIYGIGWSTNAIPITTLTAPAVDALIDPRVTLAATWTYSDTESNVQVQYEIGYKATTSSTWITATVTSATTSHTFAANLFADETNYDLRVRTKDATDWSAYSVSTFRSDTWTYKTEVTTATQSGALATTGFEVGTYEVEVRTTDAYGYGPWSTADTFIASTTIFVTGSDTASLSASDSSSSFGTIAGTDTSSIAISETSNVASIISLTPALTRHHTGASTKTTGATIAATIATADTTIGNTLIALIGFDNLSATTPIISSISKPGGETASWVKIAEHDSSSATAAAGNRGEMWAIKTTVVWPVATAVTATISASVDAKAILLSEYSNLTTNLRGTSGQGVSTAGTPSSATSGAALVNGDFVVGGATFENNAAAGDDADTTNGSWSAGSKINSTGGGAATNVAIITQYKIISATGVQTYNPTGAADSGAIVVALIPELGTLMASTEASAMAIADTSIALQFLTVTDAFAITISEGSVSSSSLPGQEGIVVAITETSTVSITSSVTETSGISITEARTLAVILSATDSGSVASAETSTSVQIQATATSDTSSVSTSETILLNVAVAGTEDRTLSVSETNTSFRAIAVTDTSSVTISETNTFFNVIFGADTSTMSVADTSTKFSNLPGLDTGTISIVETRTTTTSSTHTDTGTIATADSSALSIFATKSAAESPSVIVSESTMLSMTTVLSTTESVAVTIVEASSIEAVYLPLSPSIVEALRQNPVGLWSLDAVSPFPDYSGYYRSSSASGTPPKHVSLVNGVSFAPVFSNTLTASHDTPVFKQGEENKSFSLEATIRTIAKSEGEVAQTYRENLYPNPNFLTNITDGIVEQYYGAALSWDAVGGISGGALKVTVASTVNPQGAILYPNSVTVPAGTPSSQGFYLKGTAGVVVVICDRYKTVAGVHVGEGTAGAITTLTLTGGWDFVKYENLIFQQDYQVGIEFRTLNPGVSGQSFWVDQVMMNQAPTLSPYFDGSIPGYEWAGTANASISRTIANVSRVNLVTNPSFEDNTNGWQGGTNSTFVRSTAQADTGSASGLVTRTTTASGACFGGMNSRYYPEGTYSASARVRLNSGTGVVVRPLAFKDDFSITYNQVGAGDVTPTVNGWSTCQFTFTIPAGGANVLVLFSDDPSATNDIGNSYYLDAVQVEVGATASTYFDGSAPGAIWSGTPNASPSYMLISESEQQVLGNLGQMDGLLINGPVVSFVTKYLTAPESRVTYDLQTARAVTLVGIHTAEKNSLYVEGALVGEIDITEVQQADSFVTTSSALRTGACLGSQQIAINNVGIYAKALPTEAIKTHTAVNRDVPSPSVVANAFAGDQIPVSLNNSDIFLDQEWSTEQDWKEAVMSNVSVLNSALVPQFQGATSLSGEWLDSFALASSDTVSIYGVQLYWNGEGAIVQASLDGTTWETAQRGVNLGIIPAGFNPTDKELQIRISFAGGILNDLSFVDNLNLIGLRTGVNPEASGRTVTLVNAYPQREHEPLELREDWGTRIPAGGSLTISPDITTEALHPRTIELWIKRDAANPVISVTGTTYQNGELSTSTLVLGHWTLMHIVAPAAVTGSIVISGPAQVGNVVIYESLLSALRIAAIHSAYVGTNVRRVGDNSVIAITESPEAADIYAHDWTISGAG